MPQYGDGSEYAVVLPEGDGVKTLQWALQERQKVYQQKLLREKQLRDRQEDLSKFVDKQFEYKDYASGTVADPVIATGISDLKQKYAAQIRNNPGMGVPELMYNMQNDVSKLTGYSSNAKLVKANIDKSMAQYGKDQGIDADALAKGATQAAFLKVDPNTGQPVINDKLDPSQDYVANYLKDYPEKVITGPQGVVKAFTGLPTTDVTTTVQTDKNGRKHDVEVKAALLPHQELTYDKHNNPKLQFKTQDVQIGDEKKVKGLDEGAFNEYFTMPGAQAVLNMETKRQYPKLVRGTPDYDAAQRKVGLDIANQYARGSKLDTKDLTSEAMWRQKADAGITINTGEKKEKKENVFDVLKNIKGGDLSYIADQTPNDKGLIDITNALPSGILYSGRIKKTQDGTASKEAFDAVYFNPITNTFYTQDEKKGKNSDIKEIKPEDERKVFQGLAEANGVPVKKFTEIWDTVKQPQQTIGGMTGKDLFNKLFGKKKPATPNTKGKAGINWQ